MAYGVKPKYEPEYRAACASCTSRGVERNKWWDFIDALAIWPESQLEGNQDAE